jgi:hypothetical protein
MLLLGSAKARQGAQGCVRQPGVLPRVHVSLCSLTERGSKHGACLLNAAAALLLSRQASVCVHVCMLAATKAVYSPAAALNRPKDVRG